MSRSRAFPSRRRIATRRRAASRTKRRIAQSSARRFPTGFPPRLSRPARDSAGPQRTMDAATVARAVQETADRTTQGRSGMPETPVPIRRRTALSATRGSTRIITVAAAAAVQPACPREIRILAMARAIRECRPALRTQATRVLATAAIWVADDLQLPRRGQALERRRRTRQQTVCLQLPARKTGIAVKATALSEARIVAGTEIATATGKRAVQHQRLLRAATHPAALAQAVTATQPAGGIIRPPQRHLQAPHRRQRPHLAATAWAARV